MRIVRAGMKRRAAGDVGRLAPEAMVLDAEKICTSCFRVWKTEAAKSIWRLTGWPLRLLINGRFWPAGAEKECADGLKAWGHGPLAGQAGNKDASCWKMWRLKNSHLLFLLAG